MSHLYKTNSTGFTLVELLVSLVLCGIIIIGLTRFFVMSQWSYSLQDQITEMHQNAHYTLKKLTDVLMEAGADLPDSGVAIIQQGSRLDSIVVITNPCGGINFFSTACTTQKIPVGANGMGFSRAEKIMKKASPPLFFDIDTAYNSFSFVRGIKTVSDTDTVKLKSTQIFKAKDTIYACNIEPYFLNNKNFCVYNSSNILAENIDTLRIIFLDKNFNPTTNWYNMRTARIKVTTRTALPDKKYTKFADGYRRVNLSTEFMLKNKLRGE